MEKVISGESYARTATIEDDVVVITHVTQLKDGKHYMTTRVDLSGESSEDIMVNAAYNMLIQSIRPRALKPHTSDEIDEDMNYRPCDFPGNGGGLTTEQRNRRFLKEIGLDEERIERVMAKPEGLAEAINKALNDIK